MKGRWDLQKEILTRDPWMIGYSLQLQCGICGIEQGFIGKAEEGVRPGFGDWRILPSLAGGHADPLQEQSAVVCGIKCADDFVHHELVHLFGSPS